MPSTADCPDSLEQIYELNRLFLQSLRSQEAEDLRETKFPSGAVRALRSADADVLDAVAEYPRALFDVGLEEPRMAAKMPAVSSARQILEMTIMFCAWKMSRDSEYHARLFFGMAPDVIHTLRTTALSELPRIALTRARIDCAFPDADWLWRELLTETRPEARRQLILIALQPSVDGTRLSSRVADYAGP